MEAVVLARGEGEVLNKKTEVLGESELKTTLQRSVTLTVAAERPRSYFAAPKILAIKWLWTSESVFLSPLHLAGF